MSNPKEISHWYGPSYAADRAAYNAVGLPSSPYSCNVGSQIKQLTGWTNIVVFHSSADYINTNNKGLCMNACSAYPAGTLVHPICAE